MTQRAHIVRAAVLLDDQNEVVVGVRDRRPVYIGVDGQLLVLAVVVHIGARGDFGAQDGRALADGQSTLQPNVLRIAFRIYPQQVIA